MNPIRLNEREAREFSSELRNDRSDNVRRRQPGTIATTCGLGAASSSCSYAAVVIARALFPKGANFTAAMAIELGSTNLIADVGHHYGDPARLAVQAGPIHGRATHARNHGCSVSDLSQAGNLSRRRESRPTKA